MAILGETGIDPGQLCLEITETTVMADAESSLEVLEKLRGLGVELAIDDFGTGYSSLSYLKRFPVDVLKIDRSFVDGLGHDPDDTAIVQAIMVLASSLGLSVTAEGVETDTQLAELVRLGCDRVQGYLFARPETAAEVSRAALVIRPTVIGPATVASPHVRSARDHHPRPAPRLRVGLPARQGGDPPQRGGPHPGR